MELKTLQPNACGQCTACCTHMSVDDFADEPPKPNGVPCRHLAGHGCAIYGNRPPSCRLFMCGYLAGQLGDPENLRPDHLGWLFACQKVSGKTLLIIYETRPRANTKEEFGRLAFLIGRIAQTPPRNWGRSKADWRIDDIHYLPFGLAYPQEKLALTGVLKVAGTPPLVIFIDDAMRPQDPQAPPVKLDAWGNCLLIPPTAFPRATGVFNPRPDASKGHTGGN